MTYTIGLNDAGFMPAPDNVQDFENYEDALEAFRDMVLDYCAEDDDLALEDAEHFHYQADVSSEAFARDVLKDLPTPKPAHSGITVSMLNNHNVQIEFWLHWDEEVRRVRVGSVQPVLHISGWRYLVPDDQGGAHRGEHEPVQG